MQLYKIPSIAFIQKDKRLKQKKFIQNQFQANGNINSTHKNNNYYVQAQQIIGLSRTKISSPNKVTFKDNGQNSYAQGKILEQQLRLKNLQNEYDIEKSRIQDFNNAKTFRLKYPYGKQNVKISEDIIQKYSINNYQNQSQILKKFEDQASIRKKRKNSLKRLQSRKNIQNFMLYSYQTDRKNIKKKTPILQLEEKGIKQKKNKYFQEQISKQTKKIFSKAKVDEERSLSKIQKLLKQMKQKISQNTSFLTERRYQSNEGKNNRKQYYKKRIQNLNFIDHQEQIYKKKIPVVIYNQARYLKRNYLCRHLLTDISNLQCQDYSQISKQCDWLRRVNDINRLRLDRLCQRTSVKSNEQESH